MPTGVKFIFSIIVVLTAIGAYFFQAGLGHTGPSYAALVFGAIAIVAMWIFPEVSRKKSEGPAANR